LVIDGQSEGHGVTPIDLSTKPGQPQALLGCSGIPEQARVGGARPDVQPVQRRAGIPERERTGGSSERLNIRISVV
jgi:hypothetical protein